MKNLLFICCILIILFKTGNVLSNNNIFDVNNIEIDNKISENKEKIAEVAFKKGFEELISRLLLDDDYENLSTINLNQIKNLVSYYQIINPDIKEDEPNKIKVNISFDKEKMQNFFYNNNILYSDIINTNVIFFPLMKREDQYYIYSKNYFYKNWNFKDSNNLIKYSLPLENIENIQAINLQKDNIYKLNITNFFKEYDNENIVFATIEINENTAKVFLKTRIEGKNINKTIELDRKNISKVNDFYNMVISVIDKNIVNLIKSQNLIDVRTPSFLNLKIKLNKKNNLAEFSDRLLKIDLINNFYVQELNKDYVLVKIRYLGKINKIIKKLNDENINLSMQQGQWEVNLIQ